MTFEPFDREMIRRIFGVDTAPTPLGPREMSDRLESATASFPRGSVLVDLDIDAEGRVTDVRTVDQPPSTPGVTVRAIGVDADGSTRELPRAGPASPELARAVEEALREARFTPATRDGEPVPFPGFRMTVEVGPREGDPGLSADGPLARRAGCPVSCIPPRAGYSHSPVTPGT
jgi:hypothetical protein